MADLRTELSALMAVHGRLTATLMVDAARPADTEYPGLHSHFEWDDSVAGEKHRLRQAQDLIRSIRVVYREATQTEQARYYRMYSSVPTDTGRAYVPTAEALADPFHRRLLIQQMFRDMAALHAKYSHLTEWIDLLDQYRGKGDDGEEDTG